MTPSISSPLRTRSRRNWSSCAILPALPLKKPPICWRSRHARPAIIGPMPGPGSITKLQSGATDHLVRSDPLRKLLLCVAQNLHNILSILDGPVGIRPAVVFPRQNLFQPLPEISLHFLRERVERGRIDQEAAGITKQAMG